MVLFKKFGQKIQSISFKITTAKTSSFRTPSGNSFFVIPYQYKGIDSYQSDTVAVSDSQASLVYLHIALPMTEC